MAEKKTRTPTEQVKHYTRLSNGLFISEFLSIFAPFIVIGIVNYNDYFVEYDGVKMSIACVLAFALMGLATWLVAKNKFSNSFITLIIGWATVTFIFFMLGKIINDISYIMLFGLIGILGAYGLDIASKQARKKATFIKEAITQAQKEQLVDQYKDETREEKTKKIKIRVVKK